MDKKAKAEAKRVRRNKRKQNGDDGNSPEGENGSSPEGENGSSPDGDADNSLQPHNVEARTSNESE